MDIVIEPCVSLGINVAVDEVNLFFALVPFSWFRLIQGEENAFWYNMRGAAVSNEK